MGVLPLQFRAGESAESLGLTGREIFTITGLCGDIKPGQEMIVRAEQEKGESRTFSVICRLDTLVEVNYYRHGGILQTVLRSLIRD